MLIVILSTLLQNVSYFLPRMQYKNRLLCFCLHPTPSVSHTELVNVCESNVTIQYLSTL